MVAGTRQDHLESEYNPRDQKFAEQPSVAREREAVALPGLSPVVDKVVSSGDFGF